MKVIGRLGRHPDRPERLAVIAMDGRALGWFAIDETREDAAAIIARSAYRLHDDDTITEKEPG